MQKRTITKLDHGLIGNGQVLAIIAPSTKIEWLCMPRFDSPSVFASLLDQNIGGSFGFELPDSNASFKMQYVRNTNVLHTQLKTTEGVCDVYDFAPRILNGLSVHAPAEIHRLIIPRTGSPRITIFFDPKLEYGEEIPELHFKPEEIEVIGKKTKLFLHTNAPTSYIQNRQPIHIDQPLFFVLSYGKRSDSKDLAAVQSSLDLTIAGWRLWTKTCALPSFSPNAVLRSALCLKLHVYQDTGAIIAATTTSIPEAIGSERTWDYRYCWLRDAAFVTEALRRLSHLSEGEAFVRFLRTVAEGSPVQPLYGIGGEKELPEMILPHLSGFANSKPVRIGNAAYLQKQNDLMGELILCLEMLLNDTRIIQDSPDALWNLTKKLVEQAIDAYPLEDTGLWEFRTLLRHYTFSKALCWVAASRGAKIARHFGENEIAKKWDQWANEKSKEILERGFNSNLGFFTQAFDGEYADASNLLLPTLGIIDAKDPRFISTVRAYEKILAKDGLMQRYQHPDDFGNTTSAFMICSFWWVEALAMMGELDEAVSRFEKLLKYANPLWLFSEDVDPKTGMLLGNFPQAYTHVGLIHAAITIGELLEARNSKFRAWS